MLIHWSFRPVLYTRLALRPAHVPYSPVATLAPVPASVPDHEHRAAYGGGIMARDVTVPELTVDGSDAPDEHGHVLPALEPHVEQHGPQQTRNVGSGCKTHRTGVMAFNAAALAVTSSLLPQADTGSTEGAAGQGR
jgi:hypothetical protein